VPDDVGNPRVRHNHHEHWNDEDYCQHIHLKPLSKRGSVYVILVAPESFPIQTNFTKLLKKENMIFLNMKLKFKLIIFHEIKVDFTMTSLSIYVFICLCFHLGL